MLTIAVLNQKGGVGKSTLSTNLAALAHLNGKRTILLDLDRQGSAFDWYSARVDGSKLAGLGVVRADKALSLAKLREITRGFEVAVCDGPPRLGDVTRAAAVAADCVVIPLRAGAFDWWASSETLELLDAADSMRTELGMQPVRRLFVLNSAAPGARLTRNAVEAIGGLGELAPTTIGNRVAFAEVSMSGESVTSVDPNSAASKEVAALWATIRGAA